LPDTERTDLAKFLKTSIIRIEICSIQLEAVSVIHHFNCPHLHSYLEWTRDSSHSLVFDWNDETGEITGRDAEFVQAAFQDGTVSTHPIPSSWKLASTKNKADMAAVIGFSHELPDVLKDHYPQIEEDDWPEEDYIDKDGVVVIGGKRVVF
jgi:hypothetical protein